MSGFAPPPRPFLTLNGVRVARAHPTFRYPRPPLTTAPTVREPGSGMRPTTPQGRAPHLHTNTKQGAPVPPAIHNVDRSTRAALALLVPEGAVEPGDINRVLIVVDALRRRVNHDASLSHAERRDLNGRLDAAQDNIDDAEFYLAGVRGRQAKAAEQELRPHDQIAMQARTVSA